MSSELWKKGQVRRGPIGGVHATPVEYVVVEPLPLQPGANNVKCACHKQTFLVERDRFVNASVLVTDAVEGGPFEAWKKRAAACAGKHLGADDLFDESDPYDVTSNELDPRRAFESGEKPTAYVRRVFEEDFAGQAYDRELARGR